MKNLIKVFAVISILLFTTSCSQKLYEKNATFIQDGSALLQDFKKYYEPETKDRFRVKFFKNHSKKKICCGKMSFYSNRKGNLITRYTDSWESLSETEKALFEKLNIETGEAADSEALFYKLNKYWLLLHQIAHRYGFEYYDLIDEDGFIPGWDIEQRTDESVLLFLAENGHLEKFKDFEKFIRKTNEVSIAFINSESEVEDLDDMKVAIDEYGQLLYVRSKSMINVFDSLGTFKK